MAEPKIKEKRWTIDLEKKIQEEHFAEGQRYTFDPKSEKEIFVVDTPPPYPSGTVSYTHLTLPTILLV